MTASSQFQNPANDTGLLCLNSNGVPIVIVQEHDLHPQIDLGDIDETYNGVHIAISDKNNAIYLCAPTGKIHVRAPFVMKSPDGHWWQYSPDNSGALVGVDLGENEP